MLAASLANRGRIPASLRSPFLPAGAFDAARGPFPLSAPGLGPCSLPQVTGFPPCGVQDPPVRAGRAEGEARSQRLEGLI